MTDAAFTARSSSLQRRNDLASVFLSGQISQYAVFTHFHKLRDPEQRAALRALPSAHRPTAATLRRCLGFRVKDILSVRECLLSFSSSSLTSNPVGLWHFLPQHRARRNCTGVALGCTWGDRPLRASTQAAAGLSLPHLAVGTKVEGNGRAREPLPTMLSEYGGDLMTPPVVCDCWSRMRDD